jgi:hypothetical protein
VLGWTLFFFKHREFRLNNVHYFAHIIVGALYACPKKS